MLLVLEARRETDRSPQTRDRSLAMQAPAEVLGFATGSYAAGKGAAKLYRFFFFSVFPPIWEILILLGDLFIIFIEGSFFYLSFLLFLYFYMTLNFHIVNYNFSNTLISYSILFLQFSYLFITMLML